MVSYSCVSEAKFQKNPPGCLNLARHPHWRTFSFQKKANSFFCSWFTKLHLWKNFLRLGSGLLTHGSAHGASTALIQDLWILAAKLTLLSTTATALAVNTAGDRLCLSIFAHLWWINGVPVVITACSHTCGIFTAELTLFTSTAFATLFHACLDVFLPSTLQGFCPIQTITGVLGSGLAHVRFIVTTARLNVLGILTAQLALFSSTSTASVVNAFRDTCWDGLGILAAELTLLSTTATALAFNAVAHGLSSTSHQQCEQEKTRHSEMFRLKS